MFNDLFDFFSFSLDALGFGFWFVFGVFFPILFSYTPDFL